MPLSYSQGDEPVPGYRLVEPVGKGGFGAVWKAVGPGGVPAAIKIINLQANQAHTELRAFQRVKLIRHPNLVPIAGMWLKDEDGNLIGEQQLEPVVVRQSLSPNDLAMSPDSKRLHAAQLVIAMGLGDKNLYDRLLEFQKAMPCGVPRDELLSYMEDAARAIDYLNSPRHDLGFGPVAINHCDIKPQNMVIVGGAVQLCDFGLATVLGCDVGAGPIAVTPAYAAPELIRRLGARQNTDQYSLAISYYELRTGSLPFDSDGFDEVVAAHLHGGLNFSQLSTAERLVIQRATEVDPDERFPSAVEMVANLRRSFGVGSRSLAARAVVRQDLEVEPRDRVHQSRSLVDTSVVRTTPQSNDDLRHSSSPIDPERIREARKPAQLSRVAALVSLLLTGVVGAGLVILFSSGASSVFKFAVSTPLLAIGICVGLLAQSRWRANRCRTSSTLEVSATSQQPRRTLSLDDFVFEAARESSVQIPLALIYRPSCAPIELHNGTNLVAGSDPDCTIPLTTSQAYSRHAVISAKQGSLWIQRLPGATSPVCVNQAEIEQTKLADGDEITLSDTKLRVRMPWLHWSRTIEKQLLADLSVSTDTLDPIPSKYREAAIARFLAENTAFGLERISDCSVQLANRASIECLRRSAELVDHPSGASAGARSLEDAMTLFASAVGMELMPHSITKLEHLVHGMARLITHGWSQLAIGDQLPIVFWTRHCSCEQVVDELHDLMSNQFARRYSLVLAAVLSDDAQIVQLRRRVREHLQLVQGYNAVILHRPDMEEILAGQPAAEKLRHRILDQANLSVLSPFVVGGPVPKGMFFGRENEITLVTQGILHDRGSFCIPGGRRIGKSSLLNRVSEVLAGNGATVLYLDLSIVDSYEAFAFLLDAGPFDKSQPGSSLEQGIRARIEKDRKSVGKSFSILLFDEVDQLLRFDMSRGDIFARVLRTLSASSYSKFVLVGEEILFRALHNANCPLYNFARTIRLNMLDEKSAHELLVRPLERLRVRWDCSPAVRQRLFEVTHCHPNVLQVIGEILISRLNEADSRTITDPMIESVTCDERLRDYAWDTLWGRVPTLGRLMLLATSDRPFLPQDLAEDVERMGVPTDSRQMKDAMIMLDLYGLAQRAEGGYRRTLDPARVWGSEYTERRRTEMVAELRADLSHV